MQKQAQKQTQEEAATEGGSGVVQASQERKQSITPAELESTYILAQRMYRALPTITESQLREYFFGNTAMRAASYTMFKQLTARDTTPSEFAGISLVNDTTSDLREHQRTEQEQLAILAELKAKLEVLTKQAKAEKEDKRAKAAASKINPV